MKIRRTLRTDTIILATLLGVFSGFYIWAPILQELKIRSTKQKQKVSTMIPGKMIKIGIGFIGIYLSIVGIKIKLIPYLNNKRRKEAEEFANIIYRSESE